MSNSNLVIKPRRYLAQLLFVRFDERVGALLADDFHPMRINVGPHNVMFGSC